MEITDHTHTMHLSRHGFGSALLITNVILFLVPAMCLGESAHRQAQRLNARLYQAVEQDYMDGSTTIAKHLLQQGADPNGRCADGMTFLGEAVTCKDHALVHYLISHGVQVNARSSDHDGETPLITAIRGEDEIPFRALLAAGAQVNARDRHGYSALMWAVLWATPHERGEAMVKDLLERGANVNAMSRQGETALSWAIRFHASPEMLHLLRSAGAHS